MASVTKTRSRRAEGTHNNTHHQRHSPHHIRATHSTTTRPSNILRSQHAASSSTRLKRPLEQTSFDHLSPKRARITVEILARPQPPINAPPPQLKSQSIAVPPKNASQKSTVATPHPIPPPQPTAPPKTTTATQNHATHGGRTKHQEKVINGIKHELDRLQPTSADAKSAKEQGRKLRSQEATRFKSELAAYFPDYDEVIGNDPKEQHILNLDTPIILLDTRVDHYKQPRSRSGSNTETQDISSQSNQYPVRGYRDSLYTDLTESQRIDFSFLEARYKGKTLSDPLPDAVFEPAHKKAERLEKSIRNTERGRAQHEKDQIVRLLSELQGPDWLRTMGVSGITESKKKQFEPAREHFIKGCQAILEKFRNWSIEEKRRKLEKERALAEEAEAEAEEAKALEDGKEEVGDSDEDVDEDLVEPGEYDAEIRDSASEGDPPDYSDVDASIAKQLHEEAMARSKVATANTSKKLRGDPPPARESEQKEITSFFQKRYERDAALSRNTRSRRGILAWGQPLPEVQEDEFHLPTEYRDEETLQSRARRKRRDRRGHK